MITDEQAGQIKEQLLKQLEAFPEDQRETVKEKITSMTNEELEEFLKQNQIAQQNSEKSSSSSSETGDAKTQCIFCAILGGQIPSYSIAENNENLAVLEINPISQGHALVLPKKHLTGKDKISESSYELAKKIAEKIKEVFGKSSEKSIKEIKIAENEITGHKILEVIPIYGDEKQRAKLEKTELEKLQEQLTLPKELENIKEAKPEKIKPIKKPKPIKPIKIKPRIP